MTNTADRIALARENLRNAQVEAWYARRDGPGALERAEDDLAAAHRELRDAEAAAEEAQA